MQDDLIGCWVLDEAPLECRKDILHGISFDFRKDGKVLVCDTGNHTYQSYFVDKDTIILSGGGWSERMIEFGDVGTQREADRVDCFIHILIKKPIKYRFDGENLVVIHRDQEYIFLKSENDI